MKPAELQISAADAGEICGLSARRIRQLAEEGRISRSERGMYQLGAVVRALLEVREAETKRRSGGDTGNERDRLRTALLQRRLDAESGRAVAEARREAEAVVDEAAGKLRAALASVAPRVTTNVAMREKIEAEINAALGSVADVLAR